MIATPDDQLHVFVGDDDAPSPVAERIVALSDGARTVADIGRAIAAEFDVDEPTALADAQEFVSLLVERKVLILQGKTTTAAHRLPAR